MRHSAAKLAVLMVVVACSGSAALADPMKKYPPPNNNCRNSGSFDGWLATFRKEAAAEGISRGTISAVFDGMTLDQGTLNRDRGQGFFAQSFQAFSSKLISPNRIQAGGAQLKRHQALMEKVEKQYGVPGPVIAAFWALESDFGGGSGTTPVLRSLATLAYDCRRPELFRDELKDALRIVDRGDLTPEEMIGSWAGELGQMQFLPSHYLKYAVDFDGDGKRNLIRSTPDVIASAANFLAGLGWKRGQPWIEEVRVGRNLPWDQADLAIQHPRSKWAGWGVTQANGQPLPSDAMPASLVLPMGRFGPAFLAYDNFQIYLKWNQSLNYTLTAAYLATRYAGAPAMRKATTEVPDWSQQEMKELQQLLARRGWEVGEPDGKMGAATRAAVKAAQLKFGLPADSYPTHDLLERLRGAR